VLRDIVAEGLLMKISIIGGAGRVGSCTAYALQLSGVVSEIILFDVAESQVKGETLDLMQGSSLLNDQRIYSGDINDAARADLIIITAGLRRQPDESRLDLVNRNVSLFRSIIDELKQSGLRGDAILLVVSNPVDILTYLAALWSGLPPKQVIGLGTLLDTSRFCSMIAETINAAPSQVRALMLGEHGDSMVPIWSSATYAGLSLEKHPDLPPAVKVKLAERTRQSGAEAIRLKGGAGWAVGVGVAVLVHAVALDQKKLLPVSSLQVGAYGIRDVCLSVPTIVGCEGIQHHVELELWPKELQDLKKSEASLAETLGAIKI
jgi:L-lactate dehydrogenase